MKTIKEITQKTQVISDMTEKVVGTTDELLGEVAKFEAKMNQLYDGLEREYLDGNISDPTIPIGLEFALSIDAMALLNELYLKARNCSPLVTEETASTITNQVIVDLMRDAFQEGLGDDAMAMWAEDIADGTL